jgi:beta-xylosidase
MTIEEKAMQLSAVMPFALLGPEGPIRSMLDAQLKQRGVGPVHALPHTHRARGHVGPGSGGGDADLMRRQMRSVGFHQALAPVMDVARDARWGRVHETFGEDPYLVTAMSVAFTRGMQGDDLRDGVLATAKHFLGYAVTEPVRTWPRPRSAPWRAKAMICPSGSPPSR